MIEFVPEPPRATMRHKEPRYGDIAEELKRNPGRWAKAIPNVTAAIASQIRSGRYLAFRPPADWEVIHRENDEGKFDIFIRYIGPQPDARALLEEYGRQKNAQKSEQATEPETLWTPDLIPDIELAEPGEP